MARLQAIPPFLIGFGLATLAGMVLRASPVMAQQAAWTDLSITRPSSASPRPPRIAPKPEAAPTTTADPSTLTPIPAGVGDATRPPAPLPVLGLRPAAPIERDQTDGETEPGVGADLAIDAHMLVVEPVDPSDGREVIPGDPRLPEDRAAFLSPPAGYDALAFQIELDPTTDARTRRLTSLDPYAPVAHRAGSWVVFPTLEAGIGGTTNVYRTSNAKPDLIFDVRPTLLAVTDWQSHALQFKATGLASAYGSFATENERSYAFEARGRLDISRRANIEVLASHSLDQEPRSSLFAPTDARSPIPYATDKIAIAYNQRINRLSLQLRGAVTDYDYHPVSTYDGTTLSNAERDLSSRELAIRAAWNFTPALAVFGETAFNSQLYRATPADGTSRDSTGGRIKAGISFGSLSQIWRGEIAAGYGHQDARHTGLQNAEGLILDANLGWRPTLLTSVLLKARSDFLTSTEPGQGMATQRLGGIELRHAFQRQLVGIAGLDYQVTNFQGVTLVERATTAELGFEYYVSKSTTLLGRYSHASLDSSAADANTTTDSVRFGVRYRP